MHSLLLAHWLVVTHGEPVGSFGTEGAGGTRQTLSFWH
jgi:hypothetical protein